MTHIITVESLDGLPVDIDIDLCRAVASKAMSELLALDIKNYEFSTTIMMLHSACVDVMLEYGWQKEELIHEITRHTDKLDDLSKDRILH